MHRYPRELDEAVWALMKAGCRSPEIRERINTGQAGVQLERPIPLRTVQDRVQRLRRSRGEPDVDSQPLEELADAIAIEFLNGARRQLWFIREATKDLCIKPEEALVLERLAKVVNELRKGSPDGPKRGVGRLPGQRTAPTQKRLLERLAEQAQREARSAPPTDPSATP